MQTNLQALGITWFQLTVRWQFWKMVGSVLPGAKHPPHPNLVSFPCSDISVMLVSKEQGERQADSKFFSTALENFMLQKVCWILEHKRKSHFQLFPKSSKSLSLENVILLGPGSCNWGCRFGLWLCLSVPCLAGCLPCFLGVAVSLEGASPGRGQQGIWATTPMGRDGSISKVRLFSFWLKD